MSNIEEMFKKQLNKESFSKPIKNHNNNANDLKKIEFDEILSQIPSDDEYQKQLEQKIKEMGGISENIEQPINKKRMWEYNSIDDLPIATIQGEKKFENPFINVSKINVRDLISTEEDVRVVIEHVFCPKCGEELISLNSVFWNPYNFERIITTECPKCHFKALTDVPVPTVKYYNKNNELIKAFDEN